MELLLLVIFGVVIFIIVKGQKKIRDAPIEATVSTALEEVADSENEALQNRAAELALPKSHMPDPAIFVHYEARASVLINSSEIAFFHALVRAMPSHLYVLAKPRLEDVIGVRKNLGNTKLGFQLRGRVKSRHIDFLVIDWSGKPLCGIELDGKSHKSQKAQAGDALKNGIFGASGVPLHRIIVGQNFAQAAQNIVSQIPSPRQT